MNILFNTGTSEVGWVGNDEFYVYTSDFEDVRIRDDENTLRIEIKKFLEKNGIKIDWSK